MRIKLKCTLCQGHFKKKGFKNNTSSWLYPLIQLPSSLSSSTEGITPLSGYIPVVIYS